MRRLQQVYYFFKRNFVRILDTVSSGGFRGVRPLRTPPALNFEQQNFFALSIKRQLGPSV